MGLQYSEANLNHMSYVNLALLLMENPQPIYSLKMLTEADRRKVDEFRAQHEENASRIAELQKSARKETFQLVSKGIQVMVSIQ